MDVKGAKALAERLGIDSPTRVFGYGLLMDHRTFGEGRPAVLRGYRLAFNGFATVEPDEDGSVYGVVLDVPHLGRFDRMEGYDGLAPEIGFYDRVEVEVGLLWRRRGLLRVTGFERAWVYVMNPRARRAAYPDVVREIEACYRHYGLPVEPLLRAAGEERHGADDEEG